MTENRDSVLDRTEHRAIAVDAAPAVADAVRPSPHVDQGPTAADTTPNAPGPRRWNEGEEKQMLYAMLFFFGLGLYAALFAALGVWLSP